ncbi:MAG: pseudouridine synthase [Verrucomicrobiaceae bacterium]|nr:pseudouridine synthase [Verrucomicrobiaceae bacterium]
MSEPTLPSSLSSGSSSTLRPSVLHLPRGEWLTVLDCLCAHFPLIPRAQWLDRIARSRVQDAQGLPIDASTPYREGLRVYYFREVENETPIPFAETILFADEHLIVVDKPHFLPVMPAGTFVEETVLSRLQRHFNNSDLTPLHRIDRHTAGLVLFSVNRATRAQYQALFREQKITKCYEAIAPALPQCEFPLLRNTRLVAGEPFFRMQEVAGTPNAETRIDVREHGADYWRYALSPISGKKHQLRVHMAALGAPICNDPLYPSLQPYSADDYAKPLKLLAKMLSFNDPLSGGARHFESEIELCF